MIVRTADTRSNIAIFEKSIVIILEPKHDMGQFKRAVDFGNEFNKKHPEHKKEVLNLFQLMKDECEDDCASVEHEIDLFIGSCEDLLKKEE